MRLPYSTMELATGAVSLSNPMSESFACWRPADTGAAQDPRVSSKHEACLASGVCERSSLGVFLPKRRTVLMNKSVLFGSRICRGNRERIGRAQWPASVMARAASTRGHEAGSRMQDSSSTPETIAHPVEQGDTLTAIAKRYRTTVSRIAVVNDIYDVDSVQAGDVLLVPSQRRRLRRVTASRMPYAEQAAQSGVLHLQGGVPATAVSSLKTASNMVAVPLYGSLPVLGFAKATVSLLLIAPVFGFCLRCMVDYIHARVSEEVSQKYAEMQTLHARHRPRLKRWQGILDEERDGSLEIVRGPAAFDGVSNPQSRKNRWPQNRRDGVEEPSKKETDEQQTLRQKQDYDEIHRSYTDLEPTYMEFLADCGLSMAGYRCDGVPSSAVEGELR